MAIDRAHHPDTYREHHDELKRRLAHDGFLGLLLIDVSEINEVERAYGSSKYEDLMEMVRKWSPSSKAISCAKTTSSP